MLLLALEVLQEEFRLPAGSTIPHLVEQPVERQPEPFSGLPAGDRQLVEARF